MSDRPIQATYLIETAFPLEQAANMMAGEQSSGTFVKTPGETPELQANHGATVLEIEPLGPVEAPTLPGSKRPADGNLQYQRAQVRLGWPVENVGHNLANLGATLAGNLFELGPFSGLKLLDFELPDSFAERYTGPTFGVAGTRRLTQVEGRPIIGTIIKPSVGLSPAVTAQQVETLIEAGLDFLKDDELMGDSPHSPFEARVDAVMEVINRFADRTGKKPMFAFNLSGELEDMYRRHDYLVAAGGTCAMINLNWVGFTAGRAFRQHCQLPIHGHRNGWGMFSRSPVLGMEFAAYQKFWRMVGVDQIHVNGLRNKFCETDESVIRSIRACQADFIGLSSPIPVVSSGQWAGQAPDTYAVAQGTDLMYLCGGGIVGHPMGITAGVLSLLQAWEAAMEGTELIDKAKEHPELAAALEFYGKRR
ncbi:MAG: ribulose-bisphosphate carboxylase large subunit family protein [Bacteroidota bacterium]